MINVITVKFMVTFSGRPMTVVIYLLTDTAAVSATLVN